MQISILRERALSLIQARYDGDTKSCCIAFNANSFYGGLKPEWDNYLIEYKRHGYVFTAALVKDKFHILGENVTLEKRTEPDMETMSEGEIVSVKDVKLKWSNYSLKLKLSFEIVTEAIPCPSN